MLQGLSEEYEPLRMALDNSTEKTDLVKTKLLQLNTKEVASGESAMLVKTRGESIIKITRGHTMYQNPGFDVLYAMLKVIK